MIFLLFVVFPLPKKLFKPPVPVGMMNKYHGVRKPIEGEWNILVLLVDFYDNQHTYEVEDFETLLFSDQGKSFRNYYKEVSYGKMEINGEVYGWFRADSSYEFYVGDGYGYESPYPRNVPRLVEEIVEKVDSQIDFSKYDNDGDGVVDGLFIVHAGPGAEITGDKGDIWSHQWQLSDPEAGAGAYYTNDGVIVDVYTIQPEILINSDLITVGVFCHEFGHILGLPDLYNVETGEAGIGDFCLMGSGSWCGSPPGSSPVHLCAWCKYFLGWLMPDSLERDVVEEIQHAVIPCAEYNPVAYRILENPYGVDWSFKKEGIGEYFLIENRQKKGFDEYLPGEGLLILHIDESQKDNTNPLHPLVGIVQADSDIYFLLQKDDRGSAEDLWKNDTAGFSPFSIPASNFYDGTPSGVSIKNISPADSIMYADLKIGIILLGKIYAFPNPFITEENQKVTILYVPTDEEKAKDSFPEFRITIYNIAGEKIRVLDKEGDEVYRYRRAALWDGKDEKGKEVPTGIYIFIIETIGNNGVIERNKGRLTLIR